MSAPDILTEEERLELELAEQARLTSGDWDSVKPGKATNFGKSFGRLIGLLKPHAVAFILVSILGAIGVFLAVIAPKILGEATNIIFEAGLSFLGVGIRPPTATWGGMLSDAVAFYTMPHFLVAPGLAISVTVLAFNLFGDGLRDALDPRSR